MRLNRRHRGCSSLNGLLCLPALLAALTTSAFSQQLTIGNFQVQVHGFFSQGFAYSNVNNVLSMPTSKGTFAMTDGGLNFTAPITDKLRIGAQVYARRIGAIGNGRVTVDWALVDYHANEHFGFRVGKVKAIVGLYNDSQDVESLQTWALMPQSLYPVDGRSGRLAYWGGDVYGTFRPTPAGQLSYTAYGGMIPVDLRDGYALSLAPIGFRLNGYRGSVWGGDLRWQQDTPGLTVGVSGGGAQATPYIQLGPFGSTDNSSFVHSASLRGYGQYVWKGLRVDAELERLHQSAAFSKDFGQGPVPVFTTTHRTVAWYSAAAYRFSPHWEIGTYHSRLYPGLVVPLSNLPADSQRIIDQVATVRYDFNRFVDLKVEEHFIDGVGDAGAFHMFYTFDNPLGLKPQTKLTIVRLGVSF